MDTGFFYIKSVNRFFNKKFTRMIYFDFTFAVELVFSANNKAL